MMAQEGKEEEEYDNPWLLKMNKCLLGGRSVRYCKTLPGLLSLVGGIRLPDMAWRY